jgi:hypothetical protein
LWLQFSRQQTVIELFSEIGLPCGIDVPLVWRFKLSEILNIDQTPLAFDFLSTKTYHSKGAKTIWIKESKSGWNKRKCTLQIAACADSV